MTAYLIASQIVLWIAVLALGVICAALARQIGVLHERIAPAGALSVSQPAVKVGDPAPKLSVTDLNGAVVEAGAPRPGRSQLIFWLSPDCPLCKGLLPVLKSTAAAEADWVDLVLASDGAGEDHAGFVRAHRLDAWPYVISEALGRAYGVAKLPHAALVDETGRVAAMGLINTREHLESLFEAKERGVPSLQVFLARRSASEPVQGA